MKNDTITPFRDFLPCSPTERQRRAFSRAMEALSGKWKMDILWALMSDHPMRFGELRRALPDITQHMLTSQLRALQADGLVVRTAFAEIPPRVEYEITEHAYALKPVLLGLVEWAAEN